MKKILKNHLVTIFIIAILAISSVLPSLIRRTVRADSVVSSVVFSEDFSNSVPPDIGDQLKKNGGKNFWGTVKNGDKNILWTDSQNIPYLNNVSNSVVSSKIDLSSSYITSANLNFNISCDTEPRDGTWNDFVVFYASKDGGWSELSRYDETFLGDENFYQENIDLREYLSKNFEFKITWNTNNTNNEHLGCAIWPIKINVEESFPPPSGSMTIADDANMTNTKIVTLHLVSERAASMKFSNDGLKWTDWLPYAKVHRWDITDKDFGGNDSFGDKLIFLQIKDANGSLSPETSITINYQASASEEENIEPESLPNNDLEPEMPPLEAEKIERETTFVESQPGQIVSIAEVPDQSENTVSAQNDNSFDKETKIVPESPVSESLPLVTEDSNTNLSKPNRKKLPQSTKVPYSVLISAFPLSVYVKSYRKLLKQKKRPDAGMELDQKILAIQDSTDTTFDIFRKVHNYCRSWNWYYTWHLNPEYVESHFITLAVFTLLVLIKIFTM